MKRQLLSLLLVVACFWASANPTHYDLLTKDFIRGKAALNSISVMSFGPEGILFIGDSKSGKVFALDLEDRAAPAERKPFAMEDVEGRLAAMLGTDPQGVVIHDLAVNPLSQNIYLAVSRTNGKELGFWKTPNDLAYAGILLKIDPAGEITEVSMDDIRHSVAEVPNVVSEGQQNWRKSDHRTEAITDIAYHNGKLYVTGLSNEEFASTLRVLNFPFKDKATTTTIEVYHVAHGKSETEAPIRTLIPYDLEGKSYLLATYTCTPFVSIPISEVKDGAHVVSKTLGEFGFGNMPIDIITYKQKDKEYILMSNTSKALIKIDPMDIPKIREGLTEPLKDGEYAVGLHHSVLSRVGITQIDNLNDSHILALQRMPNGNLNLTSYANDWM
jgi:hypothetical protein